MRWSWLYTFSLPLQSACESNRLMSDEVLQDDAPPQSLYMLVYSICLVATFVIGYVFW